ncbi:hypothetical protein ACQ4PT_028200 [Festuca glaucescens]
MSGGAIMGSRWRVEHAEEARHREVMASLGVCDAEWALCKVLEASDVKPGQNRLLLTKGMVRDGPIPRLFPELEELDDDGLNAQHTVPVTLLDAEGREKEVSLCFLNSNKAYRIKGPEWRRFVEDSGMCKGDRLDLYACRRGGDGERCLFSFTSKGGGASGGSARCTNGPNRTRQPAAADAVRDHKKRAKSRRAERQGHMGYVMDEACIGGFQGDYGCCKAAEGTREDKAPTRSWKDYATKKEREAAKGLLMLKYAILAEYYY